MPRQQTGPDVHMGRDALEHNRRCKIKGKRIIGCHDLNAMMEELRKRLILVCVENTPPTGFPEGVFSLELTFGHGKPRERTSESKKTRGTGLSMAGPEGAEGASKDKGAVGGELSKEKGAVGGETSKDNGAVGGETSKEKGAVGGETSKEKGAVGGETSKEKGAVGGETSKEKGAVGGETSKEKGAVGGETAKEPEIYDVRLLSYNTHDESWEVKAIKAQLPILKTVYNPANWPDKTLEERCKEAFINAISKKTYQDDSKENEPNFTNIYWEGTFKTSENCDKKQCFWIAGFSHIRKKVKAKQRKEVTLKDVQDYEVQNFYFIHEDDKWIHDREDI